MIELLILFELNKKTLTMYGISREISAEFSVLTKPSYGTIKPALDRLVLEGYVKSQKSISKGGRPSVCYSITNEGMDKLKQLILKEPVENPARFLSTSRVKISCCGVLRDDEQLRLYKFLKSKSENILAEAKNIQTDCRLDYYQRMVYENLVCEYHNFISLLDGLISACKK